MGCRYPTATACLRHSFPPERHTDDHGDEHGDEHAEGDHDEDHDDDEHHDEEAHHDEHDSERIFSKPNQRLIRCDSINTSFGFLNAIDFAVKNTDYATPSSMRRVSMVITTKTTKKSMMEGHAEGFLSSAMRRRFLFH